MIQKKMTLNQKILLEELGDQWTKMGEGFTKVGKAFDELADKIAKVIKEMEK